MLFAVVMAIGSVVTSIIAPKILGEATTTIYDGLMKGYAQLKAGQAVAKMPIDFAKIGRIAGVVLALYLVSGLFSFAQQAIMNPGFRSARSTICAAI